MRKFVRHPSAIPIEFVVTRRCDTTDKTHLSNISNGGFACVVPEALPLGCDVQLRIPSIWPDYSGHGSVMWCREVNANADQHYFEVGIAFKTQDAFKTKMVEQLCQIEEYRQRAWLDEGRRIDGEEAAREWIALFAEEFSKSFQQSQLHG
jgi:hypothetical protein